MQQMVYIIFTILFECQTLRPQVVQLYRDAANRLIDLIVIGHPKKCLNLLYIDHETYQVLCKVLKDRQLLQVSHEVVVKELITIFLLAVDHNERN